MKSRFPPRGGGDSHEVTVPPQKGGGDCTTNVYHSITVQISFGAFSAL